MLHVQFSDSTMVRELQQQDHYENNTRSLVAHPTSDPALVTAPGQQLDIIDGAATLAARDAELARRKEAQVCQEFRTSCHAPACSRRRMLHFLGRIHGSTLWQC